MKVFFTRFEDNVAMSTRIFLAVFMVAGLLIYSFYTLSAVNYPFGLDYGEAPLVDQAIRLAQGENIYRPNIDTPPYTITNYPPVFLLTLLPFANDPPGMFQAGRLISVVSALLTAVFIGLITHTLSQNRFAAIVAAATFLTIPYVVTWSNLLRIDLVALVLSMAGLLVLIRWPSSRFAMIGGGLLLLAAIYTRQSYALAAPLAAFGWLWTQQGRQRALELTTVVGGLGLLLFIGLTIFTGGGFWFHIVRANVNPFSWERVWDLLVAAGELMPFLIIGGLLLIALGYKRVNGWPLLALYALGAFLSALTIGKVGSNINYFLELCAALSLLMGALLAWRETAPWQAAAIMVLLALQLGWLMRGTMDRVDNMLTPRKVDEGALVELESQLKQTDGVILADEYMGLLTKNEQPLYLQPFETSQLANDGIWDQTPLLDSIAAQEFPYILIHHFGPYPLHRERWTPEMLDAIETHYRPSQTQAGSVLFTPKEGARGWLLPDPSASGSFIPEIQVGDLTTVSTSPYAVLPHITINPQNPDHIAATTISIEDIDCEFPECAIDAGLYVSQDGGQSWQAQTPFTAGRALTFNPIAEFAPDGTLFVVGIRDGVVTRNHSTAANDYTMELANQNPITRGQIGGRPWLQIAPQSGDLYLSYGAQLNSRRYVTPSLLRSRNGGERWSSNARADQRVFVDDFEQNFRATPPEDIQLMFGEGSNMAMVWVWDSVPFTWPRDVWIAASSNGGRSFEPPQQLGETWGPISASSENGRYYLTYRSGSETSPDLTLVTSEDNGQSWHTASFNGNVSLNFDVTKGPGLDVAPDGTIDLVFSAPAETCERTLESWGEALAEGNSSDPCSYDVYYTYSEDNGRSFSQPLRLNDTPIIGEQFGPFGAGSHMGMAASDTAAFPLWIATSDNGTQAVTVKIER
ncbi:MAG: hypothetical protein AAF614_30420 [Chloroflexota bacterium]